MGIPGFFRWVSKKYPLIMDDPRSGDQVSEGPVFDNLYLDLNGLIHNCVNEGGPEDHVMAAILKYIDKMVSLARPRRILYLAVDGFAPHAKIRQQRDRRVAKNKEKMDKEEEIRKIREALLERGAELPPEDENEGQLDGSWVKTGTAFMERLSECLHAHIHSKLSRELGLKDVAVILSDASVPGEAEHKIADFIRRQRQSPGYSPNTRHCLYGADADLVLLGLASHEPHFTILREKVAPWPCELCRQTGHHFRECIGLRRPHVKRDKPQASLQTSDFTFVRLNVLREYLQMELSLDKPPFPYDFERSLDDWVFLCLIIGNDFLPVLPSLQIKVGAMEQMVEAYKRVVFTIKGYVTDSGSFEAEHLHLLTKELGLLEESNFKKQRQLNLRQARQNNRRGRRFNIPDKSSKGPQNSRDLLTDASTSIGDSGSDVEEIPKDVNLWEEGWKERYYQNTFQVSSDNKEFIKEVAGAYAKGLLWASRYYYQGCQAWNWVYPYHHAPFASDLELATLPSDFKFELGDPFRTLKWTNDSTENLVHLAAPETLCFRVTKETKMLNAQNHYKLYLNQAHPSFPYFSGIDMKSEKDQETVIDPSLGLSGTVLPSQDVLPLQENIPSPLSSQDAPFENKVLCFRFQDPTVPENFVFKARKLPKTAYIPKVLKTKKANGGWKNGCNPSKISNHESRTTRFPSPPHNSPAPRLEHSSRTQFTPRFSHGQPSQRNMNSKHLELLTKKGAFTNSGANDSSWRNNNSNHGNNGHQRTLGFLSPPRESSSFFQRERPKMNAHQDNERRSFNIDAMSGFKNNNCRQYTHDNNYRQYNRQYAQGYQANNQYYNTRDHTKPYHHQGDYRHQISIPVY